VVSEVPAPCGENAQKRVFVLVQIAEKDVAYCLLQGKVVKL
jgi:hypothetical protein